MCRAFTVQVRRAAPRVDRKRISERSAAKVKGHRLFEGQADGRKVRHARTHLNVGEGCAQRLTVPEDKHDNSVTVHNMTFSVSAARNQTNQINLKTEPG